MGSPYRSAPTTEAAQSPRDRGIVGDIIEQFADRFAFFRELVQNAIDAETSSIEVELRYDATEATMTVRVTDQGEGMDRDVIENRLLVLFRSTKEQDDTKIGKFGIGFASVLAIGPTVIRVDSVRDGRRHVLHLYPDLSYELFDTGNARNPGTVVELEVPLAADHVDSFAMASWESLEKWCRHASVPITLVAYDSEGNKSVDERIDRPLELVDAVFQVQATSPDRGTTVVVGVSRDNSYYAGFFNHGLMLFETTLPMLGRLSFKIQDARLGHTLSRDDVRRDAAFERALDFARHVAETRLPDVAASDLLAAADAGDHNEYNAVFSGVCFTRLSLSKQRWVFPLLHPVNGKRSIDARRFVREGAWCAGSASPLTEGMARGGVPVVDLMATGSRPIELARNLERITGVAPRDVHADLVMVDPVEHSGSDLVFVDRLTALLGHVYREPEGVVIASLVGAHADRLSVAGGPDRALLSSGTRETSEPWVLNVETSRRNPLGLLGRSMLVLNANCDPVRQARRRAQTSPSSAADHIARLVLIRLNKLDVSRSAKLLEIGVGGILESL